MIPGNKMLHRRLVQIILLCGVAIVAATMVVSWSELLEQGLQVMQVMHTPEPLLDRLDRVVDPCPALLPSFTFPIPVDHRRFHGKRNSSQPCRFVVVTTVTGAYDKVDLSFPQTSGPNLCFFIFFDEASARASVPEAELENACFLSKPPEVSHCVPAAAGRMARGHSERQHDRQHPAAVRAHTPFEAYEDAVPSSLQLGRVSLVCRWKADHKRRHA